MYFINPQRDCNWHEIAICPRVTFESGKFSDVNLKVRQPVIWEGREKFSLSQKREKCLNVVLILKDDPCAFQKRTLRNGTTTACYFATIHTDASLLLGKIASKMSHTQTHRHILTQSFHYLVAFALVVLFVFMSCYVTVILRNIQPAAHNDHLTISEGDLWVVVRLSVHTYIYAFIACKITKGSALAEKCEGYCKKS